jgi:hypothetical protein
MLPIVQYWHSREIPADVAALIATFAEHNPGRPHLVFDAEAAEELIAERFSAVEVAAFRACAIPAMQADYFRYCAAHALGGVCVDVDCRCVAPLDSMLEEGGARLFQHAKGGVVNGLMAFGRPGHPLPRLALEVATANVESRRIESVWATTGPFVTTTLARFQRDGSFEATLERAGEGQFGELFEGARRAIGDYARLSEAFEGVLIRPYEEISRWIRDPDPQPAYKHPVVNWANPGKSIFRERA